MKFDSEAISRRPWLILNMEPSRDKGEALKELPHMWHAEALSQTVPAPFPMPLRRGVGLEGALE